MLTSMFWINHGLKRNEKSLALLSNCVKSKGKSEAHEQLQKKKAKLECDSLEIAG